MASARTPHRLRGAAAPDLAEARTWIGSRVTDSNGTGVGRLEDVWVDAETGAPAWLLIREGRFGGGSRRLVPFDGATAGGGQVWLPHGRETIKTSPEIGAQEVLSPQLGDRLREHYGSPRRRRTPR